MKTTFETRDSQEAKRMLMSDNMACFIWELVNNGWRDFKHTEYDYEPAWNKINELLETHGIIIDDLWN